MWHEFRLEDLKLLQGAFLVLILATVIGWEREAKDRPAGLRTHIIVGLSAWLLVTIGQLITERYDHGGSVRLDPLRILEAIIAGISFIGAGTIFVSGAEKRVQGITTAAGLLSVAAISAAVGFGLPVLASALTIIIFVVLHVLGRLEPQQKGIPKKA